MTDPTSESRQATARLNWQMGNWPDLAALPVDPPEKGALSRAQAELLLYKMQGLFLTGAVDEGRALAVALRRAGVSRRALAAGLLSGAASNAARAWMVLHHRQQAEAALTMAVTLNPEGAEPESVIRLRAGRDEARGADLAAGPEWTKRRKLFIDCGGYDGCSVLKFLLTFPEYDAVTFEPNPELWRYYDELPTTLIGKAAYIRDGQLSFRIDPVDGDGSTLVEGKAVDFHGQVPNEECPVIDVPCIDLSAYVARMAQSYDRIVLKLDVEGAEYEILEKMLADHALSDVDQLFCEFHYDKIGMSIEKHRDIVTRVGKAVSANRGSHFVPMGQ